MTERRAAVEPHPALSQRRQCELLSVCRAGLYYEPAPVSQADLALMHRIDELFTEHPFYGRRRITAALFREDTIVNHKHVGRLMRAMGLEAIYPKPKTSIPDKQHEKFPYLLRELRIERPNQVWATDITYIRLRAGFVYLMAIIDWFSRYVIDWQLSTTLDDSFCCEALDRALSRAQPEIFNSDQGVQFTSKSFVALLKKANVSISMDGVGRAFDNIFVERLWRSLKYEEVYIKDYPTPMEANSGISSYLGFFNNERPHQALAYNTPAEVYFCRPTRTMDILN